MTSCCSERTLLSLFPRFASWPVKFGAICLLTQPALLLCYISLEAPWIADSGTVNNFSGKSNLLFLERKMCKIVVGKFWKILGPNLLEGRYFPYGRELVNALHRFQWHWPATDSLQRTTLYLLRLRRYTLSTLSEELAKFGPIFTGVTQLQRTAVTQPLGIFWSDPLRIS